MSIPPPPPGPPPPPPPGGGTLRSKGKPKSSADEHSALLESIRKGKALKHAVTNDRSAPIIGKTNGGGGPVSSTGTLRGGPGPVSSTGTLRGGPGPVSSTGTLRGGPGPVSSTGTLRGGPTSSPPSHAPTTGPVGLGILFADGIPKLRPTGPKISFGSTVDSGFNPPPPRPNASAKAVSPRNSFLHTGGRGSDGMTGTLKAKPQPPPQSAKPAINMGESGSICFPSGKAASTPSMSQILERSLPSSAVVRKGPPPSIPPMKSLAPRPPNQTQLIKPAPPPKLNLSRAQSMRHGPASPTSPTTPIRSQDDLHSPPPMGQPASIRSLAPPPPPTRNRSFPQAINSLGVSQSPLRAAPRPPSVRPPPPPTKSLAPPSQPPPPPPPNVPPPPSKTGPLNATLKRPFMPQQSSPPIPPARNSSMGKNNRVSKRPPAPPPPQGATPVVVQLGKFYESNVSQC
ncbi:unnamed protein product [Darwinula stevensoni]|uniref:WH2 domain-containing protein n=1 Tax=Darwinula stevensoni TaxID=69355 RepID=A0A7R8XDQ1_9CRUS|nr:unnamed protein product [Darwinula stevensoni]CAG0893714.1 unnamed protein product [Darwinula stevensoni]